MFVFDVLPRVPLVLWFLVAFPFIYIFVQCYLNYRKCSGFRGPFLAAISNIWLIKSTLRRRVYLDCFSLLEKYGTYARIAPDKIATNDVDLWRFVNSARSPFTRGIWYDAMTLDPNSKNSLSHRDDKEHNKIRAKMIRGYSGKDIPALESTIDHSVSALVDLIRREGVRGVPVDLAEISSFFTLDVLTHIAFGAPVGFLAQNEDIFSYLKQTSDFLITIDLGANISFIQSILNSALIKPLRPKPTDKSGMGAMLGVAKRVAEERLALYSTTDTKPRNDMLDSFIRNGLTQKELESESMLTIIGGSDSAATAIRMTFLMILSNPHVYNTLLAELTTSRPPSSRATHPVIPSSQAQRLPYLQACIKEGLRMFPPVTGLQGKLSPPEGLQWTDTVFIPGGIEVCWCPWSMQRRTDIFGPDADTFRPERWIEAEAAGAAGQAGVAKLARMNQTLDVLFGHGKYSCLGKTVAWMELDKVFVALFENFMFSLVEPWGAVRSVSHGVHVQSDMWVRVAERELTA